MANRQITIPDEINLKLRLEENASFLITKLLNEHYKNSEISRADLDKVKEQMIREKEAKDSAFKKELEKLDYELIQSKREKEAERQRQLTQKQKEEEKVNHIRQCLNSECGFDISEEELQEYIKLFNEGSTNLFMFSDELKARHGKP